MAAKRNYAAEYQRRQAIARQHGFGSYWERRQARKLGYERADRLDLQRKRHPLSPAQIAKARKASVDDFERIAVHARRVGLTPHELEQLWADGDRALRRRDHAEADRIARRLGYRKSKSGPPSRIFYYHE